MAVDFVLIAKDEVRVKSQGLLKESDHNCEILLLDADAGAISQPLELDDQEL
jgi:hypothetical protein